MVDRLIRTVAVPDMMWDTFVDNFHRAYPALEIYGFPANLFNTGEENYYIGPREI